MFGFLKRLKKESSLDSQQKGRVLNSYQKKIDMFQVRNEQEGRPSIPEVSFKQLEREAYDYVKQFQSLIKHVKQTNSSLEELGKMFKSGEITENAYKLIISELTQDLSFSIESIFKLRDSLEVIKARAKLELIKEKGEFKSVQPEQQGVIRSSQHVYQGEPLLLSKAAYSSEISRWDEVISKIESALSSMTIEEETSIIENYLYLIKDKPSLGGHPEEDKRTLTLLQQRLTSILEKWAEIRSGKIEQIMNSEVEASRLRDEIKELEVRFAVGEIGETIFESKMSILKGNLRNIEQEIAGIRKFVDDMDTKVFRCTDLLRETR